jgi:hypothetical protein
MPSRQDSIFIFDINIAIFISALALCLHCIFEKVIVIAYGSSRYTNNLVVLKGHYMCFLVT